MEKCGICGGALNVIRDQPYKYSESGLDVVLLGITQYHCQSCGEDFAAIPNPDQLHKAIALDICKNKKALLLPEEIKFLRKELHLKAKDLAKILGVTDSVVSRWENGKKIIGELSDRLLRVFYLASVEDRCRDENRAAKMIDLFSNLPKNRKTIKEPHTISLNPQEWMMDQAVCAC